MTDDRPAREMTDAEAMAQADHGDWREEVGASSRGESLAQQSGEERQRLQARLVRWMDEVELSVHAVASLAGLTTAQVLRARVGRADARAHAALEDLMRESDVPETPPETSGEEPRLDSKRGPGTAPEVIGLQLQALVAQLVEPAVKSAIEALAARVGQLEEAIAETKRVSARARELRERMLIAIEEVPLDDTTTPTPWGFRPGPCLPLDDEVPVRGDASHAALPSIGACDAVPDGDEDGS